MIKGIGLDIIEIERIKRAVQNNSRFVDRILTKKEIEIYQKFSSPKRQIEFLAGRFAVKEAFAKATAQGIGKLSFQHIEVLPNKNGAPTIDVSGYEKEHLLVSITHSKQYAVAQVIITNE